MAEKKLHVYVSYEPDDQVYADRLNEWSHTNGDAAAYNRRVELDVAAPEAEATKDELRRQIAAADLVVCVISQGTGRSAWVEWELNEAKNAPGSKGLIGIKLFEQARTPPAMVDCGAIFVPFRRTSVERAVEWAMKERQTRGDFTLLDE